MKRILIVMIMLLVVTGCTSASPIDFLIPTWKSPTTSEYLGHLDITNDVNFLYHSLSDTRIENALIDIRKLELQGLYQVSKKYNDITIATADPLSNTAWGLILALVGGTGFLIPRPKEKTLINKAGLTDSREFTVL